MSQILNRVRDVDPNDSDAVKEALTAFFQNLLKHKDGDCNRWLRALENIINRFPKFCGQHRITIENYLCHFLDCMNYYNVIEAAKCSHAVQQVRPQQERTASAKSCWRDQMSALCDAAQSLISSIYTRNSSIYSRNGNTSKDDSQTLGSPLHEALSVIDEVTKSSDVTNKSAVLTIRLRNVLVFIQAMLVEIYPVAKPVRPQLILEVILQCLSASGNDISTQVTLIKVQALKTLDAIVACLGSNLIPFSSLVFRFVMQTLRWSSEHPSESGKVRCAAYRSLTSWLGALISHRAGERARSWHDELTAHVLADVTPKQHVIQLTPNAQPMKNLSKKARKKLANSLLMQSNISTHAPGEKNKINASEESDDEVAIAALECAEAFFTTCGIFLKPTTYKQVQEVLVRECYISGYRCERALSQLRALEACRKGAPPRAPPHTHHCLQLYSQLLHNSSPEISKFASQALLDIRLHLHSSPPSLNFVQDLPAPSKQPHRKRVSDRNRAVLENLLGQERMPSEDLAAKDIITIPDEPSNKKPRLGQDITENISLSSESQNSIEISDSSSVEEVEEQDDSTDYIIEINKDYEMQTEQSSQDLTDAVKPTDESDATDAESEQIDTDGKTDDTDRKTDETEGKTNETDGITDETDRKTNETDGKTDEADGKTDDDSIMLTQKDPEAVSSQEFNLYEAKTQLPFDNNEQTSPTIPLSSEVAYDFPSTGQEKVKILEKMDEDNLPSTNDSDDIHITCGQTVKNSQDVEQTNEFESDSTEGPKENGVQKSPERILENGDAISAEIEGSVTTKIVSNDAEITVEDMLADFVDEVNEESQTAA